MNNVEDYINWIDVKEASMRQYEKECNEKIPSAAWVREQLGVNQGLANGMANYCDADGVNKAIKDYRKKNGLPDEVPLSQEIKDLFENNRLIDQIMESISKGKVVEKVLQVYKLEDGLYGISLFKLYSSLTPMKTYDSEQLGIGTLDDVVDKMIEYAHEIPISQVIVKRDIGHELNKVIIQRALEIMEEEERKLTAREAIIDMAKGFDKMEDEKDDK